LRKRTCPTRLSDFGITLNDELVTSLPVQRKDMLGIEINQMPIPGIVPFYEEHDARSESGYNLYEWYELAPQDRALEVALYRIRHAIEYQKNKAQEREMESHRRKT
jgi:hypothetical protein